MRRFFVIVALLAVLLVSFSSCSSKKRVSAEEMLSDIMAETGGLPAGQIYLKGALEGSDGYFSRSICEAMYGEDAYEMLALTEDFAIYVSSVQAPYEIAVFKCFSSTDAEKLGALCLERAELLRVLLHKTEWKTLSEGASVSVKGRTVIMKVK